MEIIPLITITVGGLVCLFFLYFYVVSRREEEYRASGIALAFAILLPFPYLAAGLASAETISLILLAFTVGLPVLLLLPIGNRFESENEIPTGRIDERDIMFSRKKLAVGSDRFNEYYERHPDRKILDEKFRSLPGLMREGATQYDRVTASAADASFDAVASFQSMLDTEDLQTPAHPVNPGHMTEFMRQWIKRMGAVSVGVTDLRDYHLYSTIGRGDRYGEPVELDHKFAIALTVEMDKFYLDRSPKGPVLMESARQYLNSGAMAVVVAEFIRKLGYSSRAHIDGSYRVVCPIVARDAGLGEIGRMGLLMTPELGPRVRLAIVTTDLELIPHDRKRDHTVIDFCIRCKKCADVCPSNSISFDDRDMIDGVLQWKIDADTCFQFWSAIGTDCARCMSACPYSHPDNTLHNLIRFGIKRSGPARQVALKLDDVFYGRNPLPLDLPEWIADVI